MRRAPAGNPWLLVLPALFLVTVLFLSPHLTDAMLRSVQLAAIATLISSIVSWPLAFFLAYIIPHRFRVVALLLLILFVGETNAKKDTILTSVKTILHALTMSLIIICSC